MVSGKWWVKLLANILTVFVHFKDLIRIGRLRLEISVKFAAISLVEHFTKVWQYFEKIVRVDWWSLFGSIVCISSRIQRVHLWKHWYSTFIATINILHQPGVKLSTFLWHFLSTLEKEGKSRLEQRTQAITQAKLPHHLQLHHQQGLWARVKAQWAKQQCSRAA